MTISTFYMVCSVYFSECSNGIYWFKSTTLFVFYFSHLYSVLFPLFCIILNEALFSVHFYLVFMCVCVCVSTCIEHAKDYNMNVNISTISHNSSEKDIQ